jgi:hypothetical protein
VFQALVALLARHRVRLLPHLGGNSTALGFLRVVELLSFGGWLSHHGDKFPPPVAVVNVSRNLDRAIRMPEPERLPEAGRGLLTILQPVTPPHADSKLARQRVDLPLIRGDGKRLVNPTPEQLDASLWGD